LFIGHGSPMNAIEENRFHRAWGEIARRLPRPKAVLCISAHWETRGVFATSSAKPETIHDFSGFPAELEAFRYPAPGDPVLARRVARLVAHARVGLDAERGIDHGAWSVLCAMYPEADVPVVELSLDETQPAAFHYRLAQDLAALRGEGVLILGSGNIVHNLRRFQFASGKPTDRPEPYAWALRFNEAVKQRIASFEHAELVAYEKLGREAQLSVPTPEHYLPLLYVLAQQGPHDQATFFNDEVLSSISMTSLVVSERAVADRSSAPA
jgi:4,5-DOPA dioxygenase extradiol